jgi:hypothetical protein
MGRADLSNLVAGPSCTVVTEVVNPFQEILMEGRLSTNAPRREIDSDLRDPRTMLLLWAKTDSSSRTLTTRLPVAST